MSDQSFPEQLIIMESRFSEHIAIDENGNYHLIWTDDDNATGIFLGGNIFEAVKTIWGMMIMESQSVDSMINIWPTKGKIKLPPEKKPA